MWIRSQDTRLIIDADKLLAREVLGKYEIINIGENTKYRLGLYSSLKKAGKVMDRIHYKLNNPEQHYSIHTKLFITTIQKTRRKNRCITN